MARSVVVSSSDCTFLCCIWGIIQVIVKITIKKHNFKNKLNCRPLKPTPLPISKSKEPDEPKPKMDKLSLVTRLKMEELAKYFNAGNLVSENQTSIQKMFGVNNNANYPTVYDVYHTISIPHQVTDTYLQEKRLSVPFITPNNKPTSLIPLKRANKCEDKLLEEQDRRNTMTDVTRPLYRDDIFFSASLNRLPQYTSRTSVAYNLSVTRMPTRNDIEEEKSNECKVCSEAVKRTLVTMLDFKLLKSPSFLLLAIGGAFTMMGFYIPFMYLSGRAVASGVNEATAIWLVSAIGIANTVGRVLCGVLSSFPKVNALFVNNAALTLGGVATLFSGFSMSESYQFTYCVIFGLSICKLIYVFLQIYWCNGINIEHCLLLVYQLSMNHYTFLKQIVIYLR